MKIGIMGCGAYGIGLALTLLRSGNQVTMWTKLENEKEEIIKTRKNEKIFKDVIIPEEIEVMTDTKKVLNENDLIFLVVPVKFMKSTLMEISPFVRDQSFVIASKGMDEENKVFLHEMVKSILKTEKIGVIAGGTFAIDLVNGEMGGLTIASKDLVTRSMLRKSFGSSQVLLQETEDVIGVEICSSIKNVMAIIMGIADELNLSETTKSMLLVKIANEITYLIQILGGTTSTILTYAGLGDILLTCTSEKSRNFTFGKMLVNAKEDIEKYLNESTVEGVSTLSIIQEVLKEKKIKLELIDKLNRIIYQGEDVKSILRKG